MKTENLPVPNRPGYILAVLTLMSALAFMDRQILSVIIQPVKLEFGLSDLQIGLVTGLGFALTFGVLGVPLGRLADRRERRSLIAFCRGLGGLLGLLGGASVGFLSLMFSRAGGAVSDAGGTPASMSMLADLYPAENRSRAMSVLSDELRSVEQSLVIVIDDSVDEAEASMACGEASNIIIITRGAVNEYLKAFVIRFRACLCCVKVRIEQDVRKA